MTERDTIIANIREQCRGAEGMVEDIVDLERCVVILNPYRDHPPALIDTELLVAEMTAGLSNPVYTLFDPDQHRG